MIKTHKFNRDRKKISIKDLDLNRFEMIGSTGWGLALKYKKGMIIYLHDEYCYDEYFIKAQMQNDDAVSRKLYTIVKINEHEPLSKKNTLRDNKGKPIKKYIEVEDCFQDVKNLRFVSRDDYSEIMKKATLENKKFTWYNGSFYIDDSLNKRI